MAVMNNEVFEKIQSDLKSLLGERMKLKANLGRSRYVEAEGVLEEAHPRLFILKVEDGSVPRRLSYSYADLLTKTVKITPLEDQAGNPLFWTSEQ